MDIWDFVTIKSVSWLQSMPESFIGTFLLNESFDLVEAAILRLLLFWVCWDLSLADLCALDLYEFLFGWLMCLVESWPFFSLANGCFLFQDGTDSGFLFVFFKTSIEDFFASSWTLGGFWIGSKISRFPRDNKGSLPPCLMYSSASSIALIRS